MEFPNPVDDPDDRSLFGVPVRTAKDLVGRLANRTRFFQAGKIKNIYLIS